MLPPITAPRFGRQINMTFENAKLQELAGSTKFDTFLSNLEQRQEVSIRKETATTPYHKSPAQEPVPLIDVKITTTGASPKDEFQAEQEILGFLRENSDTEMQAALPEALKEESFKYSKADLDFEYVYPKTPSKFDSVMAWVMEFLQFFALPG